MRALKAIFIVLLALITVAVVSGVAFVVAGNRNTDVTQAALEPFYTSPNPLPPGKPGDIIRSEALTPAPNLQNANAYRVLYRTEKPDHTARVSSGMLFIPTTPAPAGGRPVVSWDHPTVGMGDACAPSRFTPTTLLMDWLQGMLNQGWVVTATDYAGLGTEGIEYYLVGQNEAIDTVNAVRMARNFPGSQASNRYGVYGHSQGGHAALWTGSYGPTYAPELTLVGVAASAPAGNLTGLVNELWNTGLAWVIGGEVLTSYPAAFPGLQPDQVATAAGQQDYQGIADKCLVQGIIDGKVLDTLGKSTFTANPMSNPQWAAAITAQNAQPLPATLPVMVTESINDSVVTPSSIAAMQKQWCAAGSMLQVDWLGPLRGSTDVPSTGTHMYEGAIGGSLVTSWMIQRFAGAPAVSNCNTPPLVSPTPSSS
ncbi:MAG: lipase family protein [Actinomycetes bacterium]